MPNGRPNILLIFTDQQRLSTLGWYEDAPWDAVCKTPNLDRLREQSVLFRLAYSPCPLCSPARASIMTGLYPFAHGVTDNVDSLNTNIMELPDCEHLLSRRLQSAGYRCGYTGKWHLGTDKTRRFIYPWEPSLPKDVGFEGQNFPGHGGGGFYYPEYHEYQRGFGHEPGLQLRTDRRLCEGQVPRFGVLEHDEVEATVPFFLADHTISLVDRFAEESPESPFFIWHNFWGPHEPYVVPQKYLDMCRDVEIPVWPNFDYDSDNEPGPHRACVNPNHGKLSWEDWAEAIRHYYAFMTLIDEQIGRVLDHLDYCGIMDDTLIVFTTDHGETLGSHGGLMDKGLFHFEEIQRIPFLVKLPNGRRAGQSMSEFVSLVDIYPTFLEAAGLEAAALEAAGASEPQEPIHGRTLFDLLGRADSPSESAEPMSLKPWREDIVVESEGCVGTSVTLRTLRHGPWKYGFSFGMEEQLYNLDDDPHEMHNLVPDPANAEILQEMRHRLYHWMAEHGDPFRRKGYLPYVMRRGFQPD